MGFLSGILKVGFVEKHGHSLFFLANNRTFRQRHRRQRTFMELKPIYSKHLDGFTTFCNGQSPFSLRILPKHGLNLQDLAVTDPIFFTT